MQARSDDDGETGCGVLADAADGNVLGNLVFEPPDVRDDADVTMPADLPQHGHHIVQILLGQAAEAFVNEQRFHGDAAVLGLPEPVTRRTFRRRTMWTRWFPIRCVGQTH